jgi:hypothetical protein
MGSVVESHKVYLLIVISFLLGENMSEIKFKKVRFIHNRPEDYKIYPINGIWGGMTGRGDLICHFFLEHQEVPAVEVQPIKEDGSLGSVERGNEGEARIVRNFQMGIVVNREQAVAIAKWMLDNVKRFEEEQKKEMKK